MITVTIAADICPIGDNVPYFRSGDAEALFHDLLPEFAGADFSIANLECPFIREPSPIRKTGPTFGADDACLAGIRNSGLRALCLANNHILDHGEPGLRHTLELLRGAGLRTVGAGANLAEARRMLITPVGGVRLAILAVAEHEFSIARRDRAGANPLDLVDFVRNVKSNRSEFDYLIVLLHGGDEFHVPSPRLKETCHFMIEMGANAVIVQHPHFLGGYETYLGGHIVYGQGALVMDEGIYRSLDSFHEGFLVKLRIAGDGSSTMELVPFRQSSPVPGARRMTASEEAKFRGELEARSRAVLDDAAVEEAWLGFCRRHRHAYLSVLLAHNRVLRKLNSRGHLERWAYTRQALLTARNVVVCETHREAIETIMDRLSD